MKHVVKELKKLAEEQGWTVEPTKGAHWKFIPPDRTKPMVVLAGTSCSRVGRRNALALWKKSGLDLAA